MSDLDKIKDLIKSCIESKDGYINIDTKRKNKTVSHKKNIYINHSYRIFSTDKEKFDSYISELSKSFPLITNEKNNLIKLDKNTNLDLIFDDEHIDDFDLNKNLNLDFYDDFPIINVSVTAPSLLSVIAPSNKFKSDDNSFGSGLLNYFNKLFTEPLLSSHISNNEKLEHSLILNHDKVKHNIGNDKNKMVNETNNKIEIIKNNKIKVEKKKILNDDKIKDTKKKILKTGEKKGERKEEILSPIVEEQKKDESKIIPGEIRSKVWRKWCGNVIDGKCFCCDKSISFEKWHCGHILARARGGSIDPENLRPTCLKCNLGMGTMHMYEFIILNEMTGVKYLSLKDPTVIFYKKAVDALIRTGEKIDWLEQNGLGKTKANEYRKKIISKRSTTVKRIEKMEEISSIYNSKHK